MILLILSLLFGPPPQETKPVYPVIPCTITEKSGDIITLVCKEADKEIILDIPEDQWPSRWSGQYRSIGHKFALTRKEGNLVAWYRISKDCPPHDSCCLETRTPTNVTVPDPR